MIFFNLYLTLQNIFDVDYFGSKRSGLPGAVYHDRSWGEVLMALYKYFLMVSKIVY